MSRKLTHTDNTNAMRHCIKNQRKKNLAVKAMNHYPGCKERLGRV